MNNECTAMEKFEAVGNYIPNSSLTAEGMKILWLECIAYSLAVIAEKL